MGVLCVAVPLSFTQAHVDRLLGACPHLVAEELECVSHSSHSPARRPEFTGASKHSGGQSQPKTKQPAPRGAGGRCRTQELSS
jgi:hypothetical protein